jgi:hypothetical protein
MERDPGTLYLRSLLALNVRNCLCRHEPFFECGNSTMFSPAILPGYEVVEPLARH